MTKFDKMFAEYIQKQSKPDPDVFTAILPDDSRVEIHGPQVPYSQEVDWEGAYPDPTNVRRKNNDQSPEPEPTDTKEDIAWLIPFLIANKGE